MTFSKIDLTPIGTISNSTIFNSDIYSTGSITVAGASSITSTLSSSGLTLYDASTVAGVKNTIDLQSSNNDGAYIRIHSDGTDNNSLEIATYGDGNEPIYIRQYSDTGNTIAHDITLMNANGDTILNTITSTGNISASGSISCSSLTANGNIILGSDTADTVTINSPLTSYSSAKFDYLALGSANPSNAYDDLLRVCSNLGDSEKVGIQLGKNTVTYNCAYLHFMHVADESDENYLAFSTHGKDNIFKMVSTGECIVSDKLTVNGPISSTGNISCSTLNNLNILTNPGAIPNKPYIPVVFNDGVMEIGKCIDFHNDSSNSDNDARIIFDAGTKLLKISHKITLPDIALNANASSTGFHNSITFNTANNDFAAIRGYCAGENNGSLEIATFDDANEPIYVRQYKYGTEAANNPSLAARTLTLLDSSGNTSVPGSFTASSTISTLDYVTATNVKTDNETRLAEAESLLSSLKVLM